MVNPSFSQKLYDKSIQLEAHNMLQGLNEARAVPWAADHPSLPITRIRFVARMTQRLDLPANAGALLRSVFGAALRQGACVTGQSECKTCPLYQSCAYPAIFETPPKPTQFGQKFSQIPNPYVIEPPLGVVGQQSGSILGFGMVLLGEAVWQQLPLLVHAWQRALRMGLGQNRAKGELLAVEALQLDGEAVPVFDLSAHKAVGAMPCLDTTRLGSTLQTKAGELTLQFDTPMRLQHEGRPLGPAQLTPRTLMSHLLRRISLVWELHLGRGALPADVRHLLTVADRLADNRSQLQWIEQSRYSARQVREMPQGGVAGHWLWRGDVTELLPWLQLGQWLHVGKGATAGLGAYQVLLPDSVPQQP